MTTLAVIIISFLTVSGLVYWAYRRGYERASWVYGTKNPDLDRKMKRYENYPEGKTVPFTRFKIVVPTQEDKDEINAASEYFHDCNIDTDYITVNQIAHEYTSRFNEGFKGNIVVSKRLWECLEDGQDPTLNFD